MSSGGARSQILLIMEHAEANRMVDLCDFMCPSRRRKGPTSATTTPLGGGMRTYAYILTLSDAQWLCCAH